MSRARTFIAANSAAAAMIGMTIVAGSGLAAAAPTPGVTRLEGSAVPFTGHVKATGTVAASQKLSVQVWLRPRLNKAESFAAAVSTPGSASFHHYLSPASYAAQFGAPGAEAAKVESWLRGAGFTGIKASPLRSCVRATGPASVINAAFHTQLKLYPASAGVSAGRYQLRANDSAISVPSSLSGSVAGVTGLDNAGPVLSLQRPGAAAIGKTTRQPTAGVKPKSAPCSFYYGEHYATGLPRQFGTTSFPTYVCGYSGAQLRKAYGAPAAATGSGQTVALIELGLTPDMFLTLHDYAKKNGLAGPASSRYSELSLGRGSQCGDPFDIEEQLDVEMSYAMAPAAHQLVVGGDGCNQGDYGLQGLFDADLAVLGTGRHPLATVASNSWGSGTEGQPPALTDIEHAILVQAAAEGVGMYFSSGDGSGVLEPASDPDAISVGGTTLGIGKGGSRLFETGWSEAISLLYGNKRWVFFNEFGAAGGGPSLLWSEPSYQTGVVPTDLVTPPGNRGGMVRSVPDISADADPFTAAVVGILVFHNKSGKPPTYTQSPVGGTSESAPLVAGLVTAAQQGQPAPFELATLQDYTNNYRLTLLMKCEGLDPGQLACRSVPPSTMSLLGLLRHVAEAERDWRNWIAPGDPAPRLYGTGDAAFDGAAAEQVLAEGAFADLAREQAATDAVLAGYPDLGTRAGRKGIAVRELWVHRIEEYARHCGHADLLRECIDGRVGQ